MLIIQGCFKMKAVVTAAGLGTRSGLDGKFRKEMLPLYDMREGKLVLRPVIDIVLTRIREAGADEVAVVLQPRDSMTTDYVKKEFPEVQIIRQEKPKGFGNAIYCARDFLDGDSLIHAGDAFMLDHNRYLSMKNETSSKLYLFHVENPSRYGNARVDKISGQILEVKEKPQNPMSNMALCAVYRFKFPLSPFVQEDDVEFTMSMQRALEAGEIIYHDELQPDLWVSVGNAETYVEKVERTFRYHSKIKS
jgi:glucose-1-phosphate thymidylyltransferase